jgi:hypothetical protein
MTLTTPKTETEVRKPEVRGCLLHADYHVWGENCYADALCWALDRPNIRSAKRLRELYELAVEEKILLNTWRLQRR